MIGAADSVVALIVFAGVVVTAAGTYFAVKRTKSGKINTSEAGKLWDESTAMRHELREQVEALQAEIARLKVEYQGRIDRLELKLTQIRARVAELESRHA